MVSYAWEAQRCPFLLTILETETAAQSRYSCLESSVDRVDITEHMPPIRIQREVLLWVCQN